VRRVRARGRGDSVNRAGGDSPKNLNRETLLYRSYGTVLGLRQSGGWRRKIRDLKNLGRGIFETNLSKQEGKFVESQRFEVGSTKGQRFTTSGADEGHHGQGDLVERVKKKGAAA